ncbi:MAG: beta-lactamase family protein [Defluviitaleaceae bacterium]|nr:beta-lactamase family protein [Defluviitaleaceae bacterium]
MNNEQVIEKIFNKATHSKSIYEAVLLVENMEGDYSVGMGYGGRNADSPMFTASIGKMFTTTCLMILEQQNKLSLDDSISKYLDAAVMNGLHIFKGVDYSSELKISNLLFQTSGIPDWLGNGRDKKIFIDNDIFLSFEEKIESIKEEKRYFAPDARTNYSDTNFSILGKIIENITEKPLAQVCREWIFNPLGLTKTYLPISKDDFMTNAYYKEKSMHRPNAMMAASGSGDGMTTASELMIFLKAFFCGGLLPENALAKLSHYGRMGLTMCGAHYGGGHVRIQLGTPLALFKGKGELLGHSGATGSFAFYHTTSGLFFAGDFNQVASPALPIITAVNLAAKIGY